MNQQPVPTTVPIKEGWQYDVVVVGGGAAGLSGAMTLGRARRSVLVIDSGQPRNAPATGIHNYLGREGASPTELLEIGRTEAAQYGVEFVAGKVIEASQLDGDRFRVLLDDGATVLARRLLVTAGAVDDLPDIPGMRERWGHEILHCPYCHGWEVQDQAIGILATGPLAAHQALLWRQWSTDITLFLHNAAEPTDEEYEQLAARGISVVDGEVAELELTDGRLSGVILAGGRVIKRDALVLASQVAARADFLTSLGLETTEQERSGHLLGSNLPADPTGATSVPGVWVAGNITNLAEIVIGAGASGVRTAGAINADLVAEETRQAVASHRTPFSAHQEREVTERVLGDRRHGLEEVTR